MVKCPYINECTSYPQKCCGCKHNEEKDYYEPAVPGFPPVIHPRDWNMSPCDRVMVVTEPVSLGEYYAPRIICRDTK